MNLKKSKRIYWFDPNVIWNRAAEIIPIKPSTINWKLLLWMIFDFNQGLTQNFPKIVIQKEKNIDSSANFNENWIYIYSFTYVYSSSIAAISQPGPATIPQFILSAYWRASVLSASSLFKYTPNTTGLNMMAKISKTKKYFILYFRNLFNFSKATDDYHMITTIFILMSTV